MKQIMFLILLFMSVVLNSQNINLARINSDITRLNRTGKHADSQRLLLKYLADESCSSYEKSYIYFLLGCTFRSIGDYESSIKFLQKANGLSNAEKKPDSLKMGIISEIAFAHFDNNNYPEARRFAKYLRSQNYSELDKNRYAYIVMQDGYLDFLRKDYDRAELNYIKSEGLLKKYSSCNRPAVLVKMMQLYAAKDYLDDAEKLYEKAMSISDSCGILKYKIYATDEIKTIFLQKGFVDKSFHYTTLLDSLVKLDAAEKRLERMHVLNDSFLDEKNIRTESKNLQVSIIFSALLLLMVIILIRICQKSLKLKEDKLKSEKELLLIKNELEIYYKKNFEADTKEKDLLFENLSRKQKDLLTFVSNGLTNKEIGEKMSISEATVKYHLKNIYSTLNIKSRKDIFMKNYIK